LDTDPVDIFFSGDDGLGETRHVFLAGNGLPGAWATKDCFTVSELGFGTGLNALALADLARREAAARKPVPRILYQSVEWSPRPVAEIVALGDRWPDLAGPAEALARVYDPKPGWNHWKWPWGVVVLFIGDARKLPAEPTPFEPADVWFLDGFAPDRNPELWDPELLRWVGQTTRPGGTAATYSAAGVVKQGLRAAGFTVVRAPGWGQKRHMVRATLAGEQDF
jgi:tRNA U34 5-methylaminomethyl-2-thiouridine-forming methyltransferase MnmC